MTDVLVSAHLDEMSEDDIVSELLKRGEERKINYYEPYPYQNEFHAAGAHYPERLLRAGNRTGKTYGACAETSFHLTGEYPDWWEGKRFNYAPRGWGVSITNETSRDIIQMELLGNPVGTGAIPKDSIVDFKFRQCGISNVVETVWVKHVKGVSILTFKCYEQGWRKFQGAALDFIHMDEEPDDLKIYMESRTRIITRDGVIYTTLTPLMGETDLITRFQEHKEGTFMITASMRECPHLKGKVEHIMADYPEHERDARMDGIPILGEGRVFSYSDNDVLTPTIEIPKHWAKISGADFGINQDHQQASCWLAHDRETDTIYIYDEYKRPNCTVTEHAQAIKSRGKEIPVAWPHDGLHREKGSGRFLRDVYLEHDVPMLSVSACYKNDKQGPQPVEPIITEVAERIETGRLKVFPHCRQWMDEFRSLHRKNGVMVAKKDDLMKAFFYGMMMLRYATSGRTYHQQAPQAPVINMWAN